MGQGIYPNNPTSIPHPPTDGRERAIAAGAEKMSREQQALTKAVDEINRLQAKAQAVAEARDADQAKAAADFIRDFQATCRRGLGKLDPYRIG